MTVSGGSRLLSFCYLLTFSLHFVFTFVLLFSQFSVALFDFCVFFSSVFSSCLFEPSSFPDFSIFSDPSRWGRDLIPIYSVKFGFQLS